MECYFRSYPQAGGYRQRLHKMWMELDEAQNDITEQRLADQVRAIKINDCLSQTELDEIQRKIQGRTEISKGKETEKTVT